MRGERNDKSLQKCVSSPPPPPPAGKELTRRAQNILPVQTSLKQNHPSAFTERIDSDGNERRTLHDLFLYGAGLCKEKKSLQTREFQIPMVVLTTESLEGEVEEGEGRGEGRRKR